ncbi:MAG TPA: Holliday junction branch migration protein RuvA [Candidatus Paceibacterota bacterium]|nr:Holliday junction branch migration protein RuvA [Candidatus Paceibacterota bacterium]
MIRQIRGTVLSVEPLGVIIDVSGWGVLVYVSAPDAFALGDEVTLMTHMAVKQDGIELYGFADPADLRFFELSLSVSGVGPKTALSLLRRASRESLEKAIGTRDVSYLTRVVGLGKKAAEKLIVEISEKLSVGEASATGEDAEVFDTLVALGYTEREARKAIGAIPASVSGKEARLKAALASGAH